MIKSLVVFYNFEEGVGQSVAALGAASKGMAGTLTNGPTWSTRDLKASGAGASVDVQIQIPDGQYETGQVLFRDLSTQEVIEIEAFQVDTKTPVVRLNVLAEPTARFQVNSTTQLSLVQLSLAAR